MSTERATEHTEVPVEVIAYVDEGVAPLVAAINKIPGLYTLDSCEGNGNEMAYCYVAHRGSTGEFASMLADIASALRSEVDACCEYRISLEWIPGNDTPMGRIASQRAFVDPLAGALSELAARTARTTPSGGDS